MPLTTVTVSIAVSQITGGPLPLGRVGFQLTTADIDGGVVAPASTVVSLDANGEATVELWPNTSGTQGTQYRVEIYSADKELQWSGLATVPESNCDLHAILSLEAPPVVDDAQAAALEAQASAAEAAASAQEASEVFTEHIEETTGAHAASAISLAAVSGLAATDVQGAIQELIDGAAGNGTVTNVTGTAPIQVATGTTTPVVSITAATSGAAGSMSAADKTKLDGVASGATANSSDATLLARANHTGSQAISTVTGLQTALDGKETAGAAAAALVTALAADITSHTALSNIGTNTHSQIDTALVRLANTSGTNTGDQTSIVGITGTIAQFNTACTDADFATGGGTATGTNTGDETGARIATLTHAASAKTVLVDADEVTGGDSAASFGLIRTLWSDVRTYLAGKAWTWTAAHIFSDQAVSRAMLKDCGATYVDKGNSGTSTQTIDYTAGNHQKITATGNHTIATSNWPPTGNLGAVLLEATNFGAYTVTWPTVNWIKPDGSTTTSVSTWLAAWTGRTTFQTSGTDFVKLWSRDGGATIYGGWAA